MTVTSSVIRGNSSANNGGGIHLPGGDLLLDQSDVIGNIAVRFGGGVLVRNGNTTITGSNIIGNQAIGNFGGGLQMEGTTTTIIDSTISQNSSGVGGGGINAPSSPLTLLNTTVSGNSTGSSGGGGILRGNGDNPLVIINSTIVRNTSDADQGGGIEVRTAPVTIENSIVAENTAGDTSSDFLRDGGQGTLAINHSLIGNADGFGTIDGNVGNLTGTEASPLNPLLGDLDDNGGPTLTHALLPGSPAIDAGDNALAFDADGNPLVFDQRGEGFDRFSGFASLTVDIGAFEIQVPDELVVSTLVQMCRITTSRRAT